MSLNRTLPGLALLAACHSEGAIQGTARDALRGVGLPDVLVVPGEPSERCPPVHARPDAAGAFSVAVCGGETYTVSFAPGGAISWRGEAVTAKAGDTVTLTAWPAGAEPGAYVLGDGLTRLAAPLQLETAVVLPSRSTVRYPLEIPGTVPRVAPGQFLLLQGSEADDRLVALGASVGPLSFDRPNPPTEMGPWSFEGVAIDAAGVVTPLPAVAAEPKRELVQDVALTWLAAADVPPGRYLVGKPDGARAWMVDFGPLR